MRKQIITEEPSEPSATNSPWLDLESLVEVELTSEDSAHPVEAALLPGSDAGWRAAKPGRQTIRLTFTKPQRLHRIHLEFHETESSRSQEYALRWSPDGGRTFQEILRQQWHFSPSGSTQEIEDHEVNLTNVTVLELGITPDTSGGSALASLSAFRLA